MKSHQCREEKEGRNNARADRCPQSTIFNHIQEPLKDLVVHGGQLVDLLWACNRASASMVRLLFGWREERVLVKGGSPAQRSQRRRRRLSHNQGLMWTITQHLLGRLSPEKLVDVSSLAMKVIVLDNEEIAFSMRRRSGNSLKNEKSQIRGCAEKNRP